MRFGGQRLSMEIKSTGFKAEFSLRRRKRTCYSAVCQPWRPMGSQLPVVESLTSRNDILSLTMGRAKTRLGLRVT